MSNRHQRRAARRRAPDLLVDHFEAGTPLHGRPHAGLKTKTVKYWSDGSYSPASWHQCFVCGWPFQSPARSAGAFLIAVQASDPHPTEAAIGAVCDVCWGSKSLARNRGCGDDFPARRLSWRLVPINRSLTMRDARSIVSHCRQGGTLRKEFHCLRERPRRGEVQPSARRRACPHTLRGIGHCQRLAAPTGPRPVRRSDQRAGVGLRAQQLYRTRRRRCPCSRVRDTPTGSNRRRGSARRSTRQTSRGDQYGYEAVWWWPLRHRGRRT